MRGYKKKILSLAPIMNIDKHSDGARDCSFFKMYLQNRFRMGWVDLTFKFALVVEK